MAKFNTPAQVTQSRYGPSRYAAGLLIGSNVHMVAKIVSHSRASSSNARPGCCRPKNNAHQPRLRASCTRKNVNGFFAPDQPRRHTSHAASAMQTYSAAHTAPNTSLGG